MSEILQVKGVKIEIESIDFSQKEDIDTNVIAESIADEITPSLIDCMVNLIGKWCEGKIKEDEEEEKNHKIICFTKDCQSEAIDNGKKFPKCLSCHVKDYSKKDIDEFTNKTVKILLCKDRENLIGKIGVVQSVTHDESAKYPIEVKFNHNGCIELFNPVEIEILESEGSEHIGKTARVVKIVTEGDMVTNRYLGKEGRIEVMKESPNLIKLRMPDGYLLSVVKEEIEIIVKRTE